MSEYICDGAKLSGKTYRCPQGCTAGACGTNVIPDADLQVLQAGPVQAAPGSLATYTVTVKNLGPGTAPDTQLITNVPFMSFQGGQVFKATFHGAGDSRCTKSPAINSTHLTCSLGNIPPGQSTQVTFTVRMPAEVPCGNHIYTGASATAVANDPDVQNSMPSSFRTLIAGCSHPVRFTFTPPPAEVFAGDTFVLGFRFTQPVAALTAESPGFTLQYPDALSVREESFSIFPPHAEASKNHCLAGDPPPAGMRSCFFHALSSSQTATYAVRLKVDSKAKCGQDLSIQYSMVRISPAPGVTVPAGGNLTSRIKIKCRGNEPPEPPKPVCDDTDRGSYTGLRGALRFGVPPAFSIPTQHLSDQCAVGIPNGFQSADSCFGGACFVTEFTCTPDGNHEWPQGGVRIPYGAAQIPCLSCRSGVCEGGTLPPPVSSPGACTDSDGGLVYGTKGSVRIGSAAAQFDQCAQRKTNPNGTITIENKPSCSGNGCFLAEKYCLNGARATKIVTCTKGCTDGKCNP